MTARGAVHRACDQCYKQKKRCEGTQPCATCDRLGKQCTYTGRDRPVSARQQATTSDNVDILSTVDRISRLELKLGLANNKANLSSDSPGAYETPWPGAEGFSSQVASPNNVLSPSAENSQYSSSPGRDIALSPLLQQQMEERFFLVPNFALDRSEFHDAPDFLRLATYALVARDPDLYGVVQHRALYQVARHRLRAFLDTETNAYQYTLSIIRCALLLCSYEFSNELYFRSWLTVGIMVRTITADSINRIDLPTKELMKWKQRSEADICAARRVFWSCFLSDRTASLTTGFSSGFAATDVRTFLCDHHGKSTGYRLQDDWRGRKLPIFAYMAITAYYWEQNAIMIQDCFTLDDPSKTPNVVHRLIESRAAELHIFQTQSMTEPITAEPIELYGSLILQLMIQSALIQIFTAAVSHDLPFHESLKYASFKSFLQLGNIDIDFGIYNNILCHTLFKAGLALLQLCPPISTDSAEAKALRDELSQGFAIIMTMLERLMLTTPAAETFVKQLQAGMTGQDMARSVPELVTQRSTNRMNANNSDLPSEDFENLLKMFDQVADSV